MPVDFNQQTGIYRYVPYQLYKKLDDEFFPVYVSLENQADWWFGPTTLTDDQGGIYFVQLESGRFVRRSELDLDGWEAFLYAARIGGFYEVMKNPDAPAADPEWNPLLVVNNPGGWPDKYFPYFRSMSNGRTVIAVNDYVMLTPELRKTDMFVNMPLVFAVAFGAWALGPGIGGIGEAAGTAGATETAAINSVFQSVSLPPAGAAGAVAAAGSTAAGFTLDMLIKPAISLVTQQFAKSLNKATAKPPVAPQTIIYAGTPAPTNTGVLTNPADSRMLLIAGGIAAFGLLAVTLPRKRARH